MMTTTLRTMILTFLLLSLTAQAQDVTMKAQPATLVEFEQVLKDDETITFIILQPLTLGDKSRLIKEEDKDGNWVTKLYFPFVMPNEDVIFAVSVRKLDDTRRYIRPKRVVITNGEPKDDDPKDDDPKDDDPKDDEPKDDEPKADDQLGPVAQEIFNILPTDTIYTDVLKKWDALQSRIGAKTLTRSDIIDAMFKEAGPLMGKSPKKQEWLDTVKKLEAFYSKNLPISSKDQAFIDMFDATYAAFKRRVQ